MATMTTAPKGGMSAAQTYVLRATGDVLSHQAAVNHLKAEAAMARLHHLRLHRIAGTVSPEAAVMAAARAAAIVQAPRQSGCTSNCSQGRRCACSGAPIAALCPRPAVKAPTLIERTASDWGALDLAHHEPEPRAGDINAQLTPRAARAAGRYRWAWRFALAGAVAAVVLALSGCGGGDDSDTRFETALAMPQGVHLLGEPVGGLTTTTPTGRQYVTVSHHPGTDAAGTANAALAASRADCAAADAAHAVCVLVSTPSDDDRVQLGKLVMSWQVAAVFCDLTSPKTDQTAALTRCAIDAMGLARSR